MKRAFLLVLLLAGFSHSVYGAQIPYLRMDHLAFLSTDIVLCEEGPKRKMFDGTYDATFTVIQSLKGSTKAEDKIQVEISSSYRRQRPFQDPDDTLFTAGKALLFLERKEEKMRPVTGGIKLIFQGEVYCYGQFMSNPGPLYLARMAPENLTIDEDTPYDLELLLKDLEIAIKKARTFTEAPLPASRADRGAVTRPSPPRVTRIIIQPDPKQDPPGDNE